MEDIKRKIENVKSVTEFVIKYRKLKRDYDTLLTICLVLAGLLLWFTTIIGTLLTMVTN